MAGLNFGTRKFGLAGIVGVILVALAVFVLLGGHFGSGTMSNSSDWPAKFQSNGEQIYFTGTSASNLPIRFQSDSVHMEMIGGGCVTCHGAYREGGRLMPRFWITVPRLTPAALFEEHKEEVESDGHGDHDAYTDDALRRAITAGIDPSGKLFDPAMPKWSMSDQDLDDLIAFLRTPVKK